MLKIALIGRPNVGKSTLFNRLIGRRKAIVHNSPGVTRDWQEYPCDISGHACHVIDTAGLDYETKDDIARGMTRQSEQAIEHADVLLFIIDVKDGVTPRDKAISRHIRKFGKTVMVLINKCEGKYDEDVFSQACALGFDIVLPISAVHGDGLYDLYAALEPYLSDAKDDSGKSAAAEKPVKITIVGKPNAGKSTFINKILGNERLLTGPKPGITRDTISIPFRWKNRDLILFDTAGLRKKSKIDEAVESMAASETIEAINMAEIVVVMLDVSQGITNQDLTIAHFAEKEGRAVVVAINKWDLIKDKKGTEKVVKQVIAKSLPQMKDVATIFMAGEKGEGLGELMRACLDTHKLWNTRVPTPALNKWLNEAVSANPPQMVQGRRLKLRYGVQIKTRPIEVALFVNNYEFTDTYKKYLINKMRDKFKLPGVPIRISLRKSSNPYANKKKTAASGKK